MFSLKILSGHRSGETFRADSRTLTVGREKSSDIPLQDPAVSRLHLKIRARLGGWFLQDLWSRNGTLVNGRRVEPGEDVPVQAGDLITLGTTSFTLSDGEDWEGQETLQMDVDLTGSALGRLKALYGDRPRTYVKNMELLHRLSEALMGSMSLPDIFQRMGLYLFDVFKRIDRVAVFQKDPDTAELQELASMLREGGEPDPESRNYSRTIVNNVLERGEPMVAHEFDEWDKSELSDSQQAIRSCMCVPLISRSRVQGILYADSLESPHSFREEDLSLLSALGSTVAVAMENAALVANLESVVDSKTRALKKVAEQLRQSEIRFKAIFRNMKSGAMVLQALEGEEDFRIVDLNESSLRIEGTIAKEQLTGRLLSKSLPFAEPAGLMEAFRRVARTGEPESLLITLPSGDVFPGYRDCYLYRLPTGELVMLYEDVTQQKLREKEQKDLQVQLFNSQKMESIGLIAGGVAHNFRNILQAIYGNTEYLEMLYSDHPEIHKISRDIAESVERGADLVQSLLHFSKRSEDVDSMESVDLSEVIDKTSSIVSRLIDQRIALELDLEPGVFMRGNASLMSQVFMNLFTNARDAMPDGGLLRIESRREGAHAVARVSDTGMGMSAETLERLFDPFYTLKEVGKGTGLGLSTSRGIVEQHHGAISASSSLGEGSTFEIRFPLAGRAAAQRRPASRIQPTAGEEKILIVDDDEVVLQSMAQLVEALGYRVIKVNRPKEALERYRSWSPDLVLIDRNMPEMDGLSCTKRMVELDPNARIVIVSGYHDVGPDGLGEEARRLIRGYLTKPCEIHQLAETISRALAA